SLYSIARMYGMSYVELARINGISPSVTLQVGLRLYIPPRPKMNAEVLLYAEPRAPVSQSYIDEVRRRAGQVTYMAMFSYEVLRDGSLKAPPLDNIPQIVRDAGAANALVVTNLEEFAFSADLAHAIFTDEAVQ